MATTPFNTQDMADFLATWHSRSDDMDFSELRVASGRAVQAAAEAEEAQRNAEAAAAWLETLRSARRPCDLESVESKGAIRAQASSGTRQTERGFRHPAHAGALGHEPLAHNAGLHLHATARREMISARSVLLLMLLLVLSLYGAYRLEHVGAGPGAASAAVLQAR